LTLEIAANDTRAVYQIVQHVRRMFDLNSDPILISNAFEGCGYLLGLLKKYPGVRVPQGWDAFETGVCTILGQLVSVTAARKFIGQLVENYGEKTMNSLTGEVAYLFPSAKVLAESDLAEVGATGARKRAIREFARAVLEKRLSLDSTQNPESFREEFLKIPGVGQWTADYMSLRGLGDADAFPASDLVIHRALAANPSMQLEKVKPWRAYAASYLWREHYENKK
jgi:AraC family transcriptional regulator of adaptative response / DNA-3-methyladenine glycosylase II